MAFLLLKPQETRMFDDLFTCVQRSDDASVAMIDLFSQSGLPRQQLAQIWRLAAVNQNGILVRERFFIGLRLIALAQQGFDPSADNVKTRLDLALPVFASKLPRLVQEREEVDVAPDDDPMWLVPATDRQQILQRFRQFCPDGRLTFQEASKSLKSSDIDVHQIMRVLSIADIDHDEALDDIQFIVAMHIIKLVRAKRTAIPPSVPQALLKSILPVYVPPAAKHLHPLFPDDSSSSDDAVWAPPRPIQPADFLATVVIPPTEPVPPTASDHFSSVQSEAMDRIDKHIAARDIHWTFENCPLTDVEAVRIAKELYRNDNQHVQSLNLENSSLEVNGIIAIAKMISQNKGLSILTLSHNTISSELMNALGKALSQNQTLRTLNIASTRIGDGEAETLAGTLRSNVSLTSIDLSRNPFGIEGARTLLSAGLAHPALERMRMSEDMLEEASEGRDLLSQYRPLLIGRPSIVHAPLAKNNHSSNDINTVKHAADQKFEELLAKQGQTGIRALPMSPRSSMVVVPSESASMSRFRHNIEELRLSLNAPLKELASKLSFSLVGDGGLTKSATRREQVHFMSLQVPICQTNRLTTILSIHSVRETLLKDLQACSAKIASVIGQMDRMCKEMQDGGPQFDILQKDLCAKLFEPHRLLAGQEYLHSSLPLFAFYRSCQLHVCDLLLAALAHHVLGKSQAMSLHPQLCVTDGIVAYVASIADNDDNLDWIRPFSEEIARRAAFRYEAQIRVLDSPGALSMAVCALHRIMACLERPRTTSVTRMDIECIMEGLGDPKLKSRFKKRLVTVPALRLSWNIESAFLKPGLAVPVQGCAFDRFVVGDDLFTLWSGARTMREKKYGYRLGSHAELGRFSNQELRQESSPPVSRWLVNGDAMRDARTTHCAQHALRSICRWNLSQDPSTSTEHSDVVPAEGDRKPAGRFTGLFSRRSVSVSRRNSRPNSEDEIARLKEQVAHEREKRLEAERSLAAVIAAQDVALH